MRRPERTPSRTDWLQGVEEWVAQLKRPYAAAGFDAMAAGQHINMLEDKAGGSTGHPWPEPVKGQMLIRINGATTIPELRQRVEKVQLDWEKVLAKHEGDKHAALDEFMNGAPADEELDARSQQERERDERKRLKSLDKAERAGASAYHEGVKRTDPVSADLIPDEGHEIAWLRGWDTAAAADPQRQKQPN